MKRIQVFNKDNELKFQGEKEDDQAKQWIADNQATWKAHDATNIVIVDMADELAAKQKDKSDCDDRLKSFQDFSSREKDLAPDEVQTLLKMLAKHLCE